MIGSPPIVVDLTPDKIDFHHQTPQKSALKRHANTYGHNTYARNTQQTTINVKDTREESSMKESASGQWLASRIGHAVGLEDLDEEDYSSPYHQIQTVAKPTIKEITFMS